MMGYIYLNIYVYLLIIEISKMGVRVITSMGRYDDKHIHYVGSRC